jgi:hypothetical protein
MTDSRRCPCHPAEIDPSATVCPICHHWSFDPATGTCSRSGCGYADAETAIASAI